jgi:tripartite-type tricarboxylate transporter receptor subunit TctC
MFNLRSILTSLAGALFTIAFSFAVHADTYPSKPIRYIVPWPPGGGSDVLARLIAQELSKAIGQQVIVDNRAGASGNIGADIAAKSAPDGYTILSAYSGTHVINPSIFNSVPFTERDFDPVILLVSVPMMVVINPSVPATSMEELIVYAKANPGKLNYGSSGSGAYNHLAGELFNKMAGTRITHIPFKGGGPAAMALLGGQIEVMFTDPTAHINNVKAGKLRALGVTSSTPAATMPGLRPIADAGVPGYDITSWNGILAPAGTPTEIIGRLNKELNAILSRTEIRQRLIDTGYVPVGGSPEQFGVHIRAEIQKWAPVIKELGIKVD